MAQLRQFELLVHNCSQQHFCNFGENTNTAWVIKFNNHVKPYNNRSSSTVWILGGINNKPAGTGSLAPTALKSWLGFFLCWQHCHFYVSFFPQPLLKVFDTCLVAPSCTETWSSQAQWELMSTSPNSTFLQQPGWIYLHLILKHCFLSLKLHLEHELAERVYMEKLVRN